MIVMISNPLIIINAHETLQKKYVLSPYLSCFPATNHLSSSSNHS